jgi:hypothetical protein
MTTKTRPEGEGKEAQTRKLREDKFKGAVSAVLDGASAETARAMLIEDGLPASLVRAGNPAPKVKDRKAADPGVSLAPPVAVQKAIAADLKADENAGGDAQAAGKGKPPKRPRGHALITDPIGTLPKAASEALQDKISANAASKRTNRPLGKRVVGTLAKAIREAKDRGYLADPKAGKATGKAKGAVSGNAASGMARKAAKPTPAPAAKPAKGKTKAAPPAKAKPAKAKSAKARGPQAPRFDWEAAEAKAKDGVTPHAPPLAKSTGHLGQLEKVIVAAREGDLKTLREFKGLPPSTYGRKVVARYATICLSAAANK